MTNFIEEQEEIINKNKNKILKKKIEKMCLFLFLFFFVAQHPSLFEL